ncbi:MAG: MetQ/NlpA family ABC transporter substrate-binding protein [Acetobacterium sp.]|uniref:MetQ/NlpA family ABC transporter substrate-binding protein n=1 Tax=Acetobacterium sp. TaxID=1872094 RepID=UPI00324207A3
MKTKIFRLISVSLALLAILSMVGCTQQASATQADKVIKLGTMSTIEPYTTVLKDELVKKGYQVEVVMFDANNMPATATSDGSIDGFIHNHIHWINTFNKENNTDLVMVEPYIFYYPMAMYSAKYKSVAEIPEQATIVIPDDPSNMESSLIMLKESGLITLNPKTGEFYSTLDIAENFKNIQLIPAEITTTARSINDADAVVTSATRIRAVGIDPKSYIAEDKTSKDCPVGLTIDSKSVDEAWVKDAMTIITSDEMRAKFEEIYAGSLTQYPKTN